MTTLDTQIVDVARRAELDPARLSHLTVPERPAYLAGRGERTWRRLAWLVAGIAIGGWLVALLAGCGGGGTDSQGRPDQTIDRPNCAASGACL